MPETMNITEDDIPNANPAQPESLVATKYFQQFSLGSQSPIGTDIVPFQRGITPDEAAAYGYYTLEQLSAFINAGGFGWQEVITSSVALLPNNGYIMNNASRVIGTLPLTCPQFGIIRLSGKGAGGWKLAQNDGQTVHFDGNSTTTGTAGFLSSQNTFDAIELICITANTDFSVISSVGNITGA